MEHKLKCWSNFYQAIVSGAKKCELRLNDRNYRVGDTLLLEELNQESGTLTGASYRVRVTHIVDVFIGLRPGYVALSIEPDPDAVERVHALFMQKLAAEYPDHPWVKEEAQP